MNPIKLLECVPNFSEGRRADVIDMIVGSIRSVPGVKVLDVDPGKAANRTVVSFVGQPDAVVEAAFLAVKKAAELIDMSTQQGEHPRFGATDVLPLIPLKNMTMDEVVEYAHKLGKRIGDELGIPGYFYEYAATEKRRKNLAACRKGEYEGLSKKLSNPDWKPDFGPNSFTEVAQKSGAVAIGARNILIAYNVNLNTKSTRLANEIAYDVRERGRVKRNENSSTREIKKDEKGNTIYEPGLLKSVKGIGWFIEEYGVAQVSYNITDINENSMHQVFDATCDRAAVHGVRVTGSELIGLVPLQVMLDAGKYFLRKQHRSVGIPDKEIIEIAVKSMGLDELAPFDPKKKIIEYLIEEDSESKFVDLTLAGFVEKIASDNVMPGGGSTAAIIAAMGAALGTMIANLSVNKRAWGHRWEEFSVWAEKGKEIRESLFFLADEDARAYNGIITAVRLPKSTEAENIQRLAAIQSAIKNAIEVPLQIIETAMKAMDLIEAMVENGIPNAITDAGVGALAVRMAIKGTGMNIRVNALALKDKTYVKETIEKVEQLEEKALKSEQKILSIIENRLGVSF